MKIKIPLKLLLRKSNNNKLQNHNNLSPNPNNQKKHKKSNKSQIPSKFNKRNNKQYKLSHNRNNKSSNKKSNKPNSKHLPQSTNRKWNNPNNNLLHLFLPLHLLLLAATPTLPDIVNFSNSSAYLNTSFATTTLTNNNLTHGLNKSKLKLCSNSSLSKILQMFLNNRKTNKVISHTKGRMRTITFLLRFKMIMFLECILKQPCCLLQLMIQR